MLRFEPGHPYTVTSKLPAPTPFLIRPWNNRLRNVNICPVLLFVKARVEPGALPLAPSAPSVVNAVSLPSATKPWVCLKAADICTACRCYTENLLCSQHLDSLNPSLCDSQEGLKGCGCFKYIGVSRGSKWLPVRIENKYAHSNSGHQSAATVGIYCFAAW